MRHILSLIANKSEISFKQNTTGICYLYRVYMFCILVGMENSLEGIIPEIGETEEERTFSIGQLKYHYLQLARQKFQGKVFVNKDTGNPIRVSRDGIMETFLPLSSPFGRVLLII